MDYEDSSNDSSSDGGEQLEKAEILGEEIELPQGIAENSNIFSEIFSVSTWKSLNPSDQAHLMKFLPKFPENDIHEKSVTLNRLFNGENFKFGSPFETFHEKLQGGYFRPDIAQLHRLMKKADRQQYKDQRKRRYFSILKNVILGRRELLELASNTSPGPLKLQRQYLSNNPADDPVLQRVKKRYFQELAAVRSEVGEYSQSSEDENYPDRAPRTLSKKQRQKLALLENSLASSDMTAVTSTLASKPSGFDLETNVTNISNPYEITDEAYKKMIVIHKKKRLSQDKNPNLNTSGITLKDIATRAQFGHKKPVSKCSVMSNSPAAALVERSKRKPSSNCSTPVSRIKTEMGAIDSVDCVYSKKIKKELDNEISKKSEESTDEEIQKALDRSEGDRNIDVESASPTNIPQSQKLIENQKQLAVIVPQLTNVDTTQPPLPMHSPSLIKDSDINTELELEEALNRINASELMQDTHACFFSLLRDVICCSPQHRMRLDVMENKLRTWETNPISPLNEWFSLVDESWSNLLDSALSFLSGDYPAELQPEDFVPYIEYKANLRSYQWIGAGRDSDFHLLALCSHWLDHREELLPISLPAELDVDNVDLDEAEDENEVVGDDVIPPPRYPTNWTVRPSTEDEKTLFQKQERERFLNPTRAFTYRLHGYESVVGPVKGIYNSQTSSSVLKPRGHNLLSTNRPNYVTVLALVRDSAARLPNGEGTRADMCTLIRDSQYLDLSNAADSTLQSVVSGALDRLHYEVDACVRFDTKRKMWVYLHRRRSETEMEKMHQQYQGVSKTSRKGPRKKTAKKVEPATAGGAKDKQDSDKKVEKPVKRLKSTKPLVKGKDKEMEDMIIAVDSESQKKDVKVAAPTELSVLAPEKRAVAQEIVTSTGKKIFIQTAFSGRGPMKFTTSPATGKAVGTVINKTLELGQTSVVKPLSEGAQTTLLKSGSVALNTTIGVTSATSTSGPFIVNSLAGTQFLTTSGQKLQIISSSPQNLGQIQSIQIGNGQNILAQSVQPGSSGTATPVAANILQNLQQVQFLTSSGQIIARTISANPKSTLATMPLRAVNQLQNIDESKGSVLKTSVTNSVRIPTVSGVQMPTPKTIDTKNLKSIRINNVSASDLRPTMSLLTSSQPRPVIDKEGDGKVKVTGIQMMQKATTKVGAQFLNVSGVHLINKPMMPKNNTSVLTGVKLVNTQQGVKMVATSATTVVQTGIPSAKATSTVAKSMPLTGQVSSNQIQQMQRSNPQIISVEALVQATRPSSANKGQTSLIQLPAAPGGLPQFAVVSQGNIQPRIIQAQQLSNIVNKTAVSQPQRTISGVGQPVKQTFTSVKMGANVPLSGVKPVILTKNTSQSQNVILTGDGGVGGHTLVFSPQSSVRPSSSLTVVQPGGQQILLPSNIQGGTLNLKNLQGVKVIPFPSGGQKVYARFVKNPQAHSSEPVTKSEEQ